MQGNEEEGFLKMHPMLVNLLVGTKHLCMVIFSIFTFNH